VLMCKKSNATLDCIDISEFKELNVS
jgi:hypothetical protein